MTSDFRETKTESVQFFRLGAGFLLVGLACFCAAVFQQFPAIPVKANSAKPMYPATNAVDGRPLTYWIANHQRSGRLDLRLKQPRKIERVGLLNARNRYQKENGASSYIVQLYAAGTLITEVSGTFNTKVDEPPWIYRRVNSEGIDRIVVQVEPISGGAAGLAEFRYE